MENSKRCSREECKRDSRIAERVVWVAKWTQEIRKESRSTLCFTEWPGSREMFIQGSLKFNPFLRILRVNSSKNIKRFLRNLKRFQTLPSVWSRLRRDALSQLSKGTQKNYHRNLAGALDVCSQMPSNSKNRFGLVAHEFSEPEHTGIQKSRIAGTVLRILAPNFTARKVFLFFTKIWTYWIFGITTTFF